MIRVSASALDILWSDLGFSGHPVALSVHSVGETDDDRARIRDDVYANLTERGLVRAGRLDPALAARLAVLADAEMLVSGECLTDLARPQPLRVVAAVAADRGVLAVQPRRTVALSAVRPGEIVAAAVGVLPGFGAGPGSGVSLPASALGAVADVAMADSSSRRARVAEQQAREVLAVQARPVLAAGQFSVRVREGRRLRRLGGVSWFVTDAGGYFGAVAGGRGDQPWFSLVPTDRAKLVARLTEVAAGTDTIVTRDTGRPLA